MPSLNALDKQGNGERSMIRGRVRWVVHVWFSDEIEKLGPTAWSDDAEEFGVWLEDLKGVYDVLFGVSSTSFSGLILRGRASNAVGTNRRDRAEVSGVQDTTLVVGPQFDTTLSHQEGIVSFCMEAENREEDHECKNLLGSAAKLATLISKLTAREQPRHLSP